MILRFISVVLVCCLVFGCKSTTQSTPEIFTTGTSWIYSDIKTDSTGATIGSTFDTVVISASSIANSQKTLTLSDGTAMVLKASGADWMLFHYNPSTAFCDETEFPGTAGDTIMVDSNVPLKVNGVIKSGTIITLIRDVNVTTTVPAGTFICSIYELDILADGVLGAKMLSYVSASVGVVRKDYYLLDSKTGNLYLSERMQLLSVK